MNSQPWLRKTTKEGKKKLNFKYANATVEEDKITKEPKIFEEAYWHKEYSSTMKEDIKTLKQNDTENPEIIRLIHQTKNKIKS